MRSQSKGIGSANLSASICSTIRTILALLQCASHSRHNDAPDQRACFLLVWSRRMLCYGFFRKLPARKNQNSWMDLQRSG
jgi:hypothetical protein